MLMRIITRAWNMAEDHHSSANIVYASCVSIMIISIDVCVHFKNSPLINIVLYLYGTFIYQLDSKLMKRNNKKRTPSS